MPLKLFVDAHVFDGIAQGTVTYISGIYSRLVKDPRFVVYVGSKCKKTAVNFLGNSDSFIHIHYRSKSKYYRLGLEIPRILKNNHIDVAHFQYVTPPRKVCAYVNTVHDLLFLDHKNYFPLIYRLKNNFLFKRSVGNSDLIATVSNYSKEAIISHYHVLDDKIVVTPNAVFLDRNEVTVVPSLVGEKYLLYVSRIEPRKNQLQLLKAWLQLRLHEKGYYLVFVGANSVEDKELQSLLATLSSDVRSKVMHIERASNRELIWLYKNTDLFVYPSIAEGFGIPPLEATMCGAKVLCSNLTAMKDFSFYGDFHVDPRDTSSFESKILWALEQPNNSNIICSDIDSRYNWDCIAKSFAERLLKLKKK